MDAPAQDVVHWLLLVGVTAVGAALAGLAQRRWWGDAGSPAGAPGRRPGRRRPRWS
jgi:hypothetical protein